MTLQSVFFARGISLGQKLNQIEKQTSLLRSQNQKLEIEIATLTSCDKIYQSTSKEYFLETFALASRSLDGSFVAFKIQK